MSDNKLKKSYIENEFQDKLSKSYIVLYLTEDGQWMTYVWFNKQAIRNPNEWLFPILDDTKKHKDVIQKQINDIFRDGLIVGIKFINPLKGEVIKEVYRESPFEEEEETHE